MTKKDNKVTSVQDRNPRGQGPGGVAKDYIRGWEFQMGTMMSVKMLRLD